MGAHEHVESFHVMLELEDPFLCNDFSERRQPLPGCATILAWIRNECHINTELGQSGFGCPGVLPVLFIETSSSLLEIILCLGRHHRTNLVTEDFLCLADHEHFPVYIIDLFNGLEVFISAKLNPLE